MRTTAVAATAAVSLLVVLALAAPLTARAAGRSAGGTGFREFEQRLKAIYQQSHPCPANGRKVGNCPGYEVGYVKHPRNGGMVSTDNMRWMTSEEYEATAQEHAPG